MKNLLLKSVFALATLLASATAYAHDFEVDGIFYNITDSTANTVEVTYKGDSYTSFSDEYSGEVNIPTSVTYNGITYSVTSIGGNAFYGCSGLTEATIPNSATSIGSFAFKDCTGLIEVTISNSVTSIGGYAFYGCSGLTEVIIPNSVTKIVGYVFYGCSGLTSVTIGNSVTSIGNNAFKGCSGLTNLILEDGESIISGLSFPDSPLETVYLGRTTDNVFTKTTLKTLTIGNKVISIANYAFSKCNSLSSVSIPNSVTKIGSYAFNGCTSLTSVTIPNSVTLIGSSAFSDCTGLTSVTIPNSVTEIGDNAFYRCSGLSKIIVESENPNYNSRDNCNAIIETKSNTLIIGCMNTSIPNSVTKIGRHAFFYSSLCSVSIPNSVTEIGDYAFSDCTGLTSVTIPNSVTEIGDNAFYRCSGLSKIIVESENPNYNSRDNCNAIIETKSNTLIIGCMNTSIPNSVTKIGRHAFSYTSLCSVSIPNSVTEIGDYAFWCCPSLTSIISLNPTPPAYFVTIADNNTCSKATLYVPKDAFAAYYLDEVWGKFANIKKIETLADSISISDEMIYLNIGDTHALNSEIIPAEATVPTICWTSDNPLVATVDENGVVTGVSKGRTAIRARAMDGSEVYSTCMVSVEVATSITLSQTEASLPVNDLMTLSYTILPDELTEKTATWSTSNPNVAGFKENADGSISIVGVSNGVATITATTTDGSNLSASCVIKVGTVGIDGIESDDNATEVARYDIHGRRLSQPTPGINIVKMSDGTTRKEIIK